MLYAWGIFYIQSLNRVWVYWNNEGNVLFLALEVSAMSNWVSDFILNTVLHKFNNV